MDIYKVGGTVTWTPPADITTVVVTTYVAYMAEDREGKKRERIGQVELPVGTNKVDVYMGYGLNDKTHILVYTKNDVGEQRTPASKFIYDLTSGPPLVGVCCLKFTDLDETPLELNGVVEWNPPSGL
jgi:hypothetical protein